MKGKAKCLRERKSYSLIFCNKETEQMLSFFVYMLKK
jgi:hypothetical protein